MAGFGSGRMGIIAMGLWAVLLVQAVSGTEFKVGGKNGWAVPSGSDTEPFNKWAERLRFHVGDTLLFKYTAKQDSVLVVSQEAFRSCNTTDPMASYDDGATVFKLSKSGPFYFISGASGHCDQGQKLVIVVMSQGGRRGAVSPAGAPALASSPASGLPLDESPAMSPFGATTPAVAPTSGAKTVVASVVSSVLVSVAVVVAAVLF